MPQTIVAVQSFHPGVIKGLSHVLFQFVGHVELALDSVVGTGPLNLAFLFTRFGHQTGRKETGHQLLRDALGRVHFDGICQLLAPEHLWLIGQISHTY